MNFVHSSIASCVYFLQLEVLSTPCAQIELQSCPANKGPRYNVWLFELPDTFSFLSAPNRKSSRVTNPAQPLTLIASDSIVIGRLASLARLFFSECAILADATVDSCNSSSLGNIHHTECEARVSCRRAVKRQPLYRGANTTLR